MQMDLQATHAPYNVMQAPYVPALTHAAFETLARGGSIVSLDASSKKMTLGLQPDLRNL